MFTRLCRLFTFLIALAATAGCESWEQTSPSMNPGILAGAAMAHAGGDKLVLFGGNGTAGATNKTWVHDVSDGMWTDKNPMGDVPLPRSGHAMAHIGSDRVLMFGGTAGENESWIYDLSNNRWMPAAMGPPGRRFHAMAHIGSDRALLFGGFASSAFQDTWIFDDSDKVWTEKTPQSESPSARTLHAMAFIGDDNVVLFGGDGADNATWLYDLSNNTWTKQTLASPAPAARRNHAMANLGSNRALLFGGVLLSSSAQTDETWRYVRDSKMWVLMPPEGNPPARSDHAMSDGTGSGDSRPIVVFGGSGASGVFADTWVYQ
jgi:N-acetylneuraminic acid mutarotase